jgi:hypothetical protein
MSQQSPVGGVRVAVLSGGLAVLLVGVFAAAGTLVPKPEPSRRTLRTMPAPTAVASQRPTAPAVTPSRNPRREPDVDRGTPIEAGLFVEVADGWTTVSSHNYGLHLMSRDGSAVLTFVTTSAMPSGPLLHPDVEAFADLQQIYGVRTSRVRMRPLPNRNVIEAASISFTARPGIGGATYSRTGECIRLRGAPDTNNISISICWAANVQDLGTVRPEIQKMIASAARSV